MWLECRGSTCLQVSGPGLGGQVRRIPVLQTLVSDAILSEPRFPWSENLQTGSENHFPSENND